MKKNNYPNKWIHFFLHFFRHGYIMIRIDGYENDATGSDWFCYHASSPLIFPPGFCERNKIELKPPTGWEDKFCWYEYLKDTNAKAAPIGKLRSLKIIELVHFIK